MLICNSKESSFYMLVTACEGEYFEYFQCHMGTNNTSKDYFHIDQSNTLDFNLRLHPVFENLL